MTVDVSLRYAALADPQDRFSEAVALPFGGPRPDDGSLASGGALAGHAPSAFPQRPGALDALLGGALGELEQAEDAFTVRVQAPEGTARDAGLPVLVFVPGGGFLSGSPDSRWFTGGAGASAEAVEAGRGAVVVTLGYRVGVLGHLHPADEADDEAVLTASQRPLRDLLTALRWVHEHIAALGGDPDQVTLAGDSAGAWYAWALAAHPQARGLFRRLALVSLPYEPPLAVDGLRRRRDTVVEALREAGHLGPQETDLSAVPTAALLDAQGAMARAFAGRGMPIMPGAQGDVPADLHRFDARAGKLPVEELALFSTREEAAAFLLPAPEEAFPAPAVGAFLGSRFVDPDAAAAWLKDRIGPGGGKAAMVGAITLHQFSLTALEVAVAAARTGTRVHLARLTLECGVPGAGSPHCFGLPFLFGNPDQWHDAPMLAGLDAEAVATTAREASAWLAGFAADGVPRDGAGVPLAPLDPAAPAHWVFAGGAAERRVPEELPLLGLARR